MLARPFWIAAQIIALLATADAGPRYRIWIAYLLASTALSVFYVPELPGWYDCAWPWVLAVTVLRTCAVLEALHFQTRQFPYWGRLMGGAFLLGLAVTGLIGWRVSGQATWEAIRDFRRYLQVWTASSAGITALLLWRLGWWRNRHEDWHAAILGLLAVGHGALTVLFFAGYGAGTGADADSFWYRSETAAMLFDSGCYLGVAAAMSSGRKGDAGYPPSRRASLRTDDRLPAGQ